MNTTALVGVVVAVITVLGTIVVQRMSGRITSQNSAIDQFQEQAERADRRATAAEKTADEAREQVAKVWQELQELQRSDADKSRQLDRQQHQLDASKHHIRVLTEHIDRELGPPAPPLPAGLHWSGFANETGA